MSNSIINIITQLLSYSDASGVTDNSQMQDINWTRRYNAIPGKNVSSDKKTVLPGQSYTIFDGITTTDMDTGTILNMQLLSSSTSLYRMTATAGLAGFRTARSIFALLSVDVSINNNSVATFTFTGATLTGVIPGDIIRVAGAKVYDQAPYVFNSLNSGIWIAIAVAGNVVQAVREPGKPFEGVTELAVPASSADIQIFSADGIQVGDKMDVLNVFSTATRRVYEVKDVTPNSITFFSANPLPNETGVAYPSIAGGHAIVFYSASKKMVYIEVDQDSVIRLNGDTGDSNRVSPVATGKCNLVGYFHKYGETYKIEVVNKSINTLNIKYFTAE